MRINPDIPGNGEVSALGLQSKIADMLYGGKVQEVHLKISKENLVKAIKEIVDGKQLIPAPALPSDVGITLGSKEQNEALIKKLEKLIKGE